MSYGSTSSQYRKLNGVPIPQSQNTKQSIQQHRTNQNLPLNNSNISQQQHPQHPQHPQQHLQQQQKQEMYIPSASSSLTQTIPTNNPLLPPNNHSHHHHPNHHQQQNHQQSGTIPNQLPSVPQPALMASNSILTLGPFKHRKDLTRESVLSTYQIMGYIAAGTYGKVYKAKLRGNLKKEDEVKNSNGNSSSNAEDLDTKTDYSLNSTTTSSTLTSTTTTTSNQRNQKDEEPLPQFYAIKKFKSDNHSTNSNLNSNLNINKNIDNNDIIHYTGISQSAIREMSLCRELNNKNITKLINIILENKSIYMIFEFCEHDLLQIIHYHSHPDLKPIPITTIKSLIWQILNGVTFLHKNWIFHRDLKPANIMVTSNGIVKIGDLGLARKFNNPLQSFYTGDKVVVTIWYRAPELLLGTRHYTPAIDLWAVGCILAELLSLRPIFKGEEAKIDINNKKSVPFQKNQFQKIIEILGTPNLKNWPNLNKYPEYNSFVQQLNQNYSNNLNQWYKLIGGDNKQCLELLYGLLKYDPEIRLTSDQALIHNFFLELPKFKENAFDGLNFKYPNRKIYFDDNDINQGIGNNQNNNNQVNQGNQVNQVNQNSNYVQNQSTANGNNTKRNNGFDENIGTTTKRKRV
ncbi:SSN3 [Candida pseudojiufengensis]|uniref:SSN3 n=1 Tax=Candida pseudojiufengensis TaxID=497109 RepID=UPI002223EF02|nr:SSN3 [Candida pseudojiufengensis]KAI5960559.1 SSN3 [Candida pseudojiufengensis]